jgi:hypothetical protein
MKKLWVHLVFGIVTFFYILFCVYTYKDYGITADEQRNYSNGRHLISYLVTQTTVKSLKNEFDHPKQSPLFDTHNRMYPLFVSVINAKNYYEWAHLINLSFSYSIFAILYYFTFSEFGKIAVSIFSVIALFTTPRFLGHLPANPKDVPFAIFYFATLIALYKHAQKSTVYRVLLFGLLLGVTQSLRSIGFSIYAIFFLYQLMTKTTLRTIVINTMLIFFIASGVMVTITPSIGANFFANLIYSFQTSKNFSQWNNTILFNGQFLRKEARPMAYLPVWILITTPVYMLVYSMLSIKYVKKHKFLSLIWLTLTTNILLYLALNPTIYNGLRHFLYLIPLLVIAMVYCVYIKLQEKKIVPLIFASLNILLLLNSIFKLHPFEYLYFNELIGGLPKAHGRYETDYWGASYKEAALWLKRQEFSKVYVCNVSYAIQYYSEGKFEVVASSDAADFTVCDVDNDTKEKFSGDVIHQISRVGVPVNIIRKL